MIGAGTRRSTVGVQEHEHDFDALLAELRAGEECAYVEREIDIRLVQAHDPDRLGRCVRYKSLRSRLRCTSHRAATSMIASEPPWNTIRAYNVVRRAP